MSKYSIVKNPLPFFCHEFLIFKDQEKIGEAEKSLEAAVLAVFEFGGWIGEYTIRFCDNMEIFYKGN